jgi:hypothetical protein
MSTVELRSSSPAESADHRLLQRWLLALLAIGLVWRLGRYLLQFPIWGDEAFICLNLVNQDYVGLTGPLRCGQVAPLLFLWGELSAFFCLGHSPLALRLLPFLAGIGGLLLTWRLAHLTLRPLARTLAVGFLAVAIWPVSMSTLIKPYSFDLLMASALLVCAVQWHQRQEHSIWLLLLALLTPIAVFSSYPIVFVAGGISLALLPAVWRRPEWRTKALFLVYNLLLFGSFLGNYLLVGLNQLDRESGSVNAFLQDYWAHGFPPQGAWAVARWFVMLNLGRLFAYPIGGSDGQSALTTLLFLVGLVVFWRRRQRALVVLFLTPFALGVVAAFLRRYPYGGCCRLSQHVAPIICILAGAGAAALLERIHSSVLRQRWTTAVCVLFALLGAGGLLIDIIRPYRGEADLWTCQVVDDLVSRCKSNDQIILVTSEMDTDAVLRWQLKRYELEGGHVGWGGQMNEERLRTTGQVWILNAGKEQAEVDKVAERLRQSERSWVLANRIPCDLNPSKKSDKPMHYEILRYTSTTAEVPVVASRWP